MAASGFVETIASAGYNVFNLTADQIELDLATDVPAKSPLPEVREAGVRGAPVDLDAVARSLYGDWRFVFAMKGRSAELALGRAVIKAGMTVVTTGLFRTTARSLTTNGAKLEVMPASLQRTGSSDLSLDWLGERVAAGRVDVVVLEPANNAVFGWPMRLDHLRTVKQACEQHGAKLVLDSTRLLANCVALGETGLDTARAYLAVADAFVTSTAKECLVPMGAVVGVRDLELQRQVWLNAFEEGSNLELAPHRAELAAGLETIRTRPTIVADRRRQLELLARLLGAAGIRFVEPIGAHAVFALFPGLSTERPHRNQELQAHLFAQSGIRFMFARHPAHQGFVVRLPLQLARFHDADLGRVVATLELLAGDAPGAPALVPVASDCVHPQYFGRYALA